MWSGTEYSGNTTGFSKVGPITLSSSGEDSYKGLKSLKVEQTEDGNSYFRVIKEFTTTPNSVYASCKMLAYSSASFSVVQYNEGTELTRETVNISSSDEWQDIYVSDAVEATCDEIRIAVNLHHTAGDIYYIDDVTLKVQ